MALLLLLWKSWHFFSILCWLLKIKISAFLSCFSVISLGTRRLWDIHQELFYEYNLKNLCISKNLENWMNNALSDRFLLWMSIQNWEPSEFSVISMLMLIFVSKHSYTIQCNIPLTLCVIMCHQLSCFQATKTIFQSIWMSSNDFNQTFVSSSRQLSKVCYAILIIYCYLSATKMYTSEK